MREFSFRARENSLERFRSEVFDILVIGGGITGAAVARDAISRGLSVALVERSDFAFGTSSRSSKLIHGGLRYLQNMEFGLVFEALFERSLLLKTASHVVKPLPFYLPVFRGDPHGRALLATGLWLYDLLALFRAPGFHRGLSRRAMLTEIPFLRQEGLKGGFQYFDASMWDDVLVVETLRSAQQGGAAVANYVEALDPFWEKDQISGFYVRDRETDASIKIQAKRTVICAGPWTDKVGVKLSTQWKRWLKPSKGVHLVFDLKRIPVPGAVVMTHAQDGRIAFVMPRPDFGAGVVIIGTTDGPTSLDPEQAEVSPEDIQYLLDLTNRTFPKLQLTREDILSTYVGVRPLMGGEHFVGSENAGDKEETATVLQKVSREHHMDRGPGGTVVVAGGKYTTHRKMAEEIVNFTLKAWREDCSNNGGPAFPLHLRKPKTKVSINLQASEKAVAECREQASGLGMDIPEDLLNRYGADCFYILEMHKEKAKAAAALKSEDPEGFSYLGARLRYAIRSEMVMHLEDFYFRRVPLYVSRKDHGLPWAESLAQIWAEERGLSESEKNTELERLKQHVQKN